MKLLVLICGIAVLSSAFTFRKEQKETEIITGPAQCIQEKCPNEYGACQNDPKCLSIHQNCENICKSDLNCWKWCLVKVGEKTAINVEKCAAANDCLEAET